MKKKGIEHIPIVIEIIENGRLVCVMDPDNKENIGAYQQLQKKYYDDENIRFVTGQAILNGESFDFYFNPSTCKSFVTGYRKRYDAVDANGNYIYFNSKLKPVNAKENDNAIYFLDRYKKKYILIDQSIIYNPDHSEVLYSLDRLKDFVVVNPIPKLPTCQIQ